MDKESGRGIQPFPFRKRIAKSLPRERGARSQRTPTLGVAIAAAAALTRQRAENLMLVLGPLVILRAIDCRRADVRLRLFDSLLCQNQSEVPRRLTRVTKHSHIHLRRGTKTLGRSHAYIYVSIHTQTRSCTHATHSNFYPRERGAYRRIAERDMYNRRELQTLARNARRRGDNGRVGAAGETRASCKRLRSEQQVDVSPRKTFAACARQGSLAVRGARAPLRLRCRPVADPDRLAI